MKKTTIPRAVSPSVFVEEAVDEVRVRRDNQDETAPFWPLWKEGRSPTVIRAKATRAGKPAGLGVVAGG